MCIRYRLKDRSADEKTKEEVKKQIAENCKKNLIPYACPVEYEFKDEFPMTRIGKIDFRALEAEAQGKTEEKKEEKEAEKE